MKVTLLLFVAVVSVSLVYGAEDEADKAAMIDSLKEALESPAPEAIKFKNLLRKILKNHKFLKTLKKAPSLACPVPGTWFETTRDEPECDTASDCVRGELCCNWFKKKHCLRGINTKPRKGKCPKIGQVNDACLADFAGCKYDEECGGEDEKCCENTLCGYKECLSTRQNLACPAPKTSFPTKRSEKNCLKDTQCGDDEKCCDWFGDKHCLKGLSTIQRPGFCPIKFPAELESCRLDFVGCLRDSECTGPQEKCCFNSKCEYHQCIDMNAEFSCPTVNIEKSLPPTESRKDCQANVDCDGFSSLCCDHEAKKECMNGIYKTPKEGECPSNHLVKRLSCLPDAEAECEYDSQCHGTKKCCFIGCERKCHDPTSSSSDSSSTEEKDEVLRELVEALKD